MAYICKIGILMVIIITLNLCHSSRPPGQLGPPGPPGPPDNCRRELANCHRTLNYCDADLGNCNRERRNCNVELYNYKSELSTTTRAYEDTAIRFVVYLVKSENYADASIELQSMNNYENQLDKVVKLTYEKNSTNVFRVVLLIKSLRWCSDLAKGLKALHNQMRYNGHLQQLEIFMLPRSVSGCRNSTAVKEVMTTVDVHVKKMISLSAKNIRSNNFTEIIDFMKRSYWNGVSVMSLLPDLFTTVLNKATAEQDFFNEVVNLLKFTHEMSFSSIFERRGYSTLIKQLNLRDREHSEESITVAYEIYTKWKTASDLNATSLPVKYYQKLAQELSPTISNLFWHTNCSIRNIHWDEYLYATNGKVFTSASGNEIPEGNWILESYRADDNDQVHFQVKNMHWSRESEPSYLCEESERHRGSVSMCPRTSGTNHLWKLIPTQWRHPEIQQLFLIKKNDEFENFMFVSQEEQEMGLEVGREVQLGEPMLESYWEIECTPSLPNENNYTTVNAF